MKKKKPITASEMGKRGWKTRKGNIARNNKGHFMKKVIPTLP